MESRRGFIHLHIGDGKGKTTAAVGMAIRAAGWNLRVLFCQFLKSSKTGELPMLESLPAQIRVFRSAMRHKAFLWEQNRNEREDTAEDIHCGWNHIKCMMESEPYDLVILDEVLDAVDSGFIDENDLMESIKGKTTDTVLTGRKASVALMEAADYVTQMTCVKHPYSAGITSRKGIEY